MTIKKRYILLSVVLLLLANFYIAHKIVPTRLVVEEIPIKHPSIPSGFDGFTIVQISDLHLGFHDNPTHLEKVVQSVQAAAPDLIVFTGDLFDNPEDQANDLSWTKNFLTSLEAPFGKYAVYGNHDFGKTVNTIYEDTMRAGGFTLLKNERKSVSLLNGDSIYIAGIDDVIIGRPDLKKATETIPDESFGILLAHEPDIADAALHSNVDVQLSGHSHGGQVRLPFVAPLITPPKGNKYISGPYTITSSVQKQELFLYVNRGIGMTRLPFRYFSTPEVTVFTLRANTP